MASSINRRQFERFCMPHMYTSIALRRLEESAFDLKGHTYDISEGGCQFELDYGIEPGTPVALQIDLPGGEWDGMGQGMSVFVFGNVVWADDSEPGPVRMAVVFSRFARAGDRDRLIRCFASGRLSRAA